MNETNAHETDSSADNDFKATKHLQGHVTINREGSGHTTNSNGTVGALILGFIALLLLRALLHSEARNRELQAQLSNSKQRQ